MSLVEKIKKKSVSVIGGAAASSATSGAVVAFGTASTGTPISSLSGAAAAKATLAFLGGGPIAAGGLGVAGGTFVLCGIGVVGAVITKKVYKKMKES